MRRDKREPNPARLSQEFLSDGGGALVFGVFFSGWFYFILFIKMFIFAVLGLVPVIYFIRFYF